MGIEFILGVDLDGVCADYNAGFRQIVAADLGVAPETLGEQTEWGYAAWGLDADEYLRIHKLAVQEKRMLRHLPMVEGCAETLWRLSDAGIWLRVITHRLYTNWSHATAVSDTVAWLDQNQIPYRDICFLGQKPQVDADAYVDDAPHNVEALRAEANTVIVFDQPYNRHLDGPRAESWAELETLVLDLAATKTAVQPQLPGIDAGANRLTNRLERD